MGENVTAIGKNRLKRTQVNRLEAKAAHRAVNPVTQP